MRDKSGTVVLDIDYPSEFVLEFTITEPNGDYSGWLDQLECANVGGYGVGNASNLYWYTANPYSYTTQTSKKLQYGDKIRFIKQNGSTSIYYNNDLKRTVTSDNTKFNIIKNTESNNTGIRIKNLTIKAL